VTAVGVGSGALFGSLVAWNECAISADILSNAQHQRRPTPNFRRNTTSPSQASACQTNSAIHPNRRHAHAPAAPPPQTLNHSILHLITGVCQGVQIAALPPPPLRAFHAHSIDAPRGPRVPIVSVGHFISNPSDIPIFLLYYSNRRTAPIELPNVKDEPRPQLARRVRHSIQ
jgi:hypothetical protein